MTDPSSSLLRLLLDDPTEEAWGRLHALYRPVLLRLLTGRGMQTEDAENVTQDVLQGMWRGMRKYDPNQGPFGAWVCGIVNNCCAQELKRRQAATGGSDALDLLHQLADPASTVSKQLEREQGRVLLQAALKDAEPRFEPKKWKAFLGHALEGKPAAEVAAELGMSANAVWIAKSRVVQQLKRYLEGLSVGLSSF